MPAIHVEKETCIRKPLSEVFRYVRDFRNWPEWSPWLICEPGADLTFGEDSYSWKGRFVGEGSMTVSDISDQEGIEYDLKFLKPWKSVARVRMGFVESGGETHVRWTMDSKLPWFLFFMKPMMECMIGMDYERGLRMMKEKLETGTVLTGLEMIDRVTVAECSYVGIERECGMDEIETVMQKDFDKLMPIYQQSGDHAEPPFTIYQKWQMSKGRVRYVVAAPVTAVPEGLVSGFITGVRPAVDAFAVVHTGPYHHLGNAWSAAMVRARARPPLFKQSKKVMPFEQYMNHPAETEEADLVTRVCLPRID